MKFGEVIEGNYRLIYLIGPDQQKVEVPPVIHSSREPQRPLE
jgi:hypothetical protein